MNYVKLALASLPTFATITPAKDNQLLYRYAAIGAADMALSYVSRGNFPKAWVAMQNASRYRALAGEAPDSKERTALQKLCSGITPVVNS